MSDDRTWSLFPLRSEYRRWTTGTGGELRVNATVPTQNFVPRTTCEGSASGAA